MSEFVLALYLGTLTVKEKCHNFNCQVIKSFNQRCELKFDGKTATLLGISMPVKQFQYGPVEGFDGNDKQSTSVTVFLKNKKPYKAYVSQYFGENRYYRWTCEFKNKKACFEYLDNNALE